jgi:putative Ig domain-containing protein
MRNMLKAAGASLVAAGILMADVGCGGSSAVPPPPPPTPSDITVTLAQTATAFDASQSDALTATVKGDPSNKGVVWTVACPQGMAAGTCGGMASQSSASGAADKFTAPNAVNAPIAIEIQAASAADHSKVASVLLTVNPAPTLVNPPPAQPAAGVVGQSFSLGLAQYVQGGTAPFTWTIKSGTLPLGLKLEPSGIIDGTPTAVTAATPVVISSSDSGEPPISVNFTISLSVNAAGSLLITNGNPPGGTVGLLYDHRCFFGHCFNGFFLLASGGVQPYLWSWAPAAGSSLPPGLSLSGSVIGGTPTVAGTYHVIVTVTDSEVPPMQSSANYTIVIQ